MLPYGIVPYSLEKRRIVVRRAPSSLPKVKQCVSSAVCCWHVFLLFSTSLGFYFIVVTLCQVQYLPCRHMDDVTQRLFRFISSLQFQVEAYMCSRDTVSVFRVQAFWGLHKQVTWSASYIVVFLRRSWLYEKYVGVMWNTWFEINPGLGIHFIFYFFYKSIRSDNSVILQMTPPGPNLHEGERERKTECLCRLCLKKAVDLFGLYWSVVFFLMHTSSIAPLWTVLCTLDKHSNAKCSLVKVYVFESLKRTSS